MHPQHSEIFHTAQQWESLAYNMATDPHVHETVVNFAAQQAANLYNALKPSMMGVYRTVKLAPVWTKETKTIANLDYTFFRARGRVGRGKEVHYIRKNGTAVCGSNTCGIGIKRSYGVSGLTDEPLTCKKCIAKSNED